MTNLLEKYDQKETEFFMRSHLGNAINPLLALAGFYGAHFVVGSDLSFAEHLLVVLLAVQLTVVVPYLYRIRRLLYLNDLRDRTEK